MDGPHSSSRSFLWAVIQKSPMTKSLSFIFLSPSLSLKKASRKVNLRVQLELLATLLDLAHPELYYFWQQKGEMPAVGFAVGTVDFEARITPILLVYCIMAGTGGLMVGYDIGISGGVTAMGDFLLKFFPVVYKEASEPAANTNYCKYDNQALQLFTSSLYLAGLVGTFLASHVTRNHGRKQSMLVASIFFAIGVVLSAAAQNLVMLIAGRILLGCGVGFAGQASLLFLSEVAPARVRGAFNNLFQLNVTIGILIANLVNYATSRIHPWGWRLSLGLASIPTLFLLLGSIIVEDTPVSLIARGQADKGKEVLSRIRGTRNVGPEFEELVAAGEAAKAAQNHFRSLMKRRNRPPLVIAALLQLFQQFTGINCVMFYAPVLFSTLGFNTNAALYSAVVTGSVNVVATCVSILLVDKAGRRALLIEAGAQMLLSQLIIMVLLGLKVKDNANTLNHVEAMVVLVMVCMFVSAFAWSWGPMACLIPTEIFPVETRSAGEGLAIFVNLLCTFIIAQSFLSMLCHLKYTIFAFFSGWILVMSIFVIFLLPETKNIPIEEMTERVWKQHWFWKSFFENTEYQRPGSEIQVDPKVSDVQLAETTTNNGREP